MFRDRIFHEERFFRGSRRGTSFQRGDLKYVILDLLKDKPRHGYDIIRELEERSYGFYKPSPGVIYPTLQMLEEMGYASSTEQEGKKVYSITKKVSSFWRIRAISPTT
jgi:DNA-binding PadR family transcriptional regulator